MEEKEMMEAQAVCRKCRRSFTDDNPATPVLPELYSEVEIWCHECAHASEADQPSLADEAGSVGQQ